MGLRRAAATAWWVRLLSGAALLALVCARPRWSWDTVQTWVRCSNPDGEWGEPALERLATKAFVVFDEQEHKQLLLQRQNEASPESASGSGGDNGNNAGAADAVDPVVASCELVKKRNPDTECYVAALADGVAPTSRLGQWMRQHRGTAVLQCPSAGDFVMATTVPTPARQQRLAFDFSHPSMRVRWVEHFTDLVATGAVDGVFLDGATFRNGFGSWSTTRTCSDSKTAAWQNGLNHSVSMLVHALGKERTVWDTRSDHSANLEVVSGTVLSQWLPARRPRPATDAIASVGKRHACGPFGQPCLLAVNGRLMLPSPQYTDLDGGDQHGFARTLAEYLMGAFPGAYYGIGGCRAGEQGCAIPDPHCQQWLEPYPEFSRPLGEPLGDMVSAPSQYEGYMLRTRKFASGTKVFIGQHAPPPPLPMGTPKHARGGHARASANTGYCVFWADGSVTGDASLCDAAF